MSRHVRAAVDEAARAYTPSSSVLDRRVRAERLRPTLERVVGAERVVEMPGALGPDNMSEFVGAYLNYGTQDTRIVLASRGGEVVTKREMLAEVWGLPFGGGDRTVDVHLSWLRRKLGETAAQPRYLHTVRGVGVRLAELPES